MSNREIVVRVCLVSVVFAGLVSVSPSLAEGGGSDLSPTLESADAQLGGTTATAKKETEKQTTEEEKAPRVGYGPPFYLESGDGDFRMDIWGYGQLRYTYEDRESDELENSSRFAVNRMRFGFKGHAFGKKLKYRLWLNVYSAVINDVNLFDYWVEYSPNTKFGVRAGQWKVPYGLQWNVSASKLQFVERSISDAALRWDRDTGVDFKGKLANGKFSYDLAVMNGEGRNRNNSGTGHLWVGRARFEPLGKFANHEGDPDNTQDHRIMFTVAGALNQRLSSHTRPVLRAKLAQVGTSDITSYNAAFGWRYRGASFTAEYHLWNLDPLSGVDEQDIQGMYVQGGYFIKPGKLEVAARWEVFDTNKDIDDDERSEAGVAIGYFLAGHKSKFQADLFRIENKLGPADPLKATRFRFQYVLSF